MAKTTVSTRLVELVRHLTNLPIEIVEAILTRLPVSAVIELCIAEDNFHGHSGDTLGMGYISQCILDSLGWKRVFRTRGDLVLLKDRFEMAVEAYNLVYGRDFSHAFVRRSKTGISERTFSDIRRLLSFQTRPKGPAHQEMTDLDNLLEYQHGRFVRKLWLSMENDWANYMNYVSNADKTVLPEFTDWLVVCPRTWVTSWVTRTEDPHTLQEKLRLMVKIQRIYRQRLEDELNQLATFYKEHPSRLKMLGDQRQQPRPNTQHIVDQLHKTAQVTSNLQFAARRPNAGNSYYRKAHLPVIPLDKWIWFFLECRSLVHRGSEMQLPLSLASALTQVMDGMPRLYSGTNTGIPRVVFRSQSRTPKLSELDMTDLAVQFRDRITLRPIFTDSSIYQWRGELPQPHDEREMNWLNAFLECCKTFSAMFPNMLEKVEKEAKEFYLPCPIAEGRQQTRECKKRWSKLEARIAANLSVRGAKFELLSRK